MLFPYAANEVNTKRLRSTCYLSSLISNDTLPGKNETNYDVFYKNNNKFSNTYFESWIQRFKILGNQKIKNNTNFFHIYFENYIPKSKEKSQNQKSKQKDNLTPAIDSNKLNKI